LVRANGSDIVDHDGKAAALTEFFKGIIGTPGSSEQIGLVGLYEGRPRPSAKLTETFTEEEAKFKDKRAFGAGAASGWPRRESIVGRWI
jgi:hypothetical protein